MKPWKQIVLIATLGLVGATAGLAAATLVLGPGAVLGTPAGQWLVRHVLGGKANLPDGRAVVFPGAAVPPLALQDLDAQPVSLQTGGQPILINYWASWCPPCIEEMPLLDAFARSQPADGVQVIGIALDEMSEVLRFLDERPVSFPIRVEAAGPNDSSMLLGNARGILPYSVLIDTQGRLQKTRLGAFRQGEVEAWATAP